jgi:hypothetical protein
MEVLKMGRLRKILVLGMIGLGSMAYGMGSVTVYNASGEFVRSYATIQAGSGWLDGLGCGWKS